MEGLVNTCELLINVVRSTKPKMLPGLSHKALERVQGVCLSKGVAVGVT
jgi:hypothetical protein